MSRQENTVSKNRSTFIYFFLMQNKYATLTTKLAIGMLGSILIFHKGCGEGGMSSFYGLHQQTTQVKMLDFGLVPSPKETQYMYKGKDSVG